MNVNVTYRLSQAGQKAALLAGRNAAATVTETLTLEDASLLDELTIMADGTLKLDISDIDWPRDTPGLDAPPQSVADLIAARRSRLEEKKAAEAQRKAEREARAEEERRQVEAQKLHDAPLMDVKLAELEARDPLGDWAVPMAWNGHASNLGLYVTPEQQARLDALRESVAAARKAAAEAEASAKAERDAAEIAQYGGWRFPVEAGLCSFKGRNLWCNHQSKRWVGLFSKVKGIDKFLDSPRGEFVFRVDSLERGDCIQGGGYDTNSRGKRRNESEWFGVVVTNEPDYIVLDVCSTRAATMKAAAKLTEEVQG